jgi:ankyrin repeat protein
VLLEDKRVQAGIDINDTFQHACGIGNADVVRYLLSRDKRVNPALNDSAALTRACEGEHKKIVKMLLLDGRVDDSVNGT